jgi:hypothetical protein
MDMKKYGRQSAFLRLDDVRQPRIETIALVKEGRYGKPDVYFESGKVLSLNATNTETLIAAYGADSDLWVTKKARLYAGTINYQNEDKAAVLVPLSQPDKSVTAKRAAAAAAAMPSDDDGELAEAKQFGSLPAKATPSGDMDDEVPF